MSQRSQIHCLGCSAHSRPITLAVVAAFLALLSACDGCSGLSSPTSNTDGAASGQPPGLPPGAGTIPVVMQTLVVEPSTVTLNATVGDGAFVQLNAVLESADGTTEPVATAYWQSVDPIIALVDQDGKVTASEERSGIARIRVRAEGLEAVAQVRVVLHQDVVLDGSAGATDFDGPLDDQLGPAVLYPPDDVVIPANLSAILFQWNPTHAHARVLLSGAEGSLTLYTNADRAQAPQEAWRRFLLVHLGQDIDVVIEESDGPGSPRVQTHQTIHLADADLSSTVYYWAVNLGKIVRIDADSLEPIELDIPYDDGPQGAVPANAGERACRACHVLSADGQRMAFTYFGGSGPGGVVDTANPSDTPVVANLAGRAWNFAALNPDGSLLLSNINKRLSLRDGNTGATIGGQEDVTGFDVAMPAFSPVGDAVAFAGDILDASGQPAGWEIDFDRSNLYVAPVNGQTVGASHQVISGEGESVYYPSFSPDGRLLAYTKGPHSRSRFNDVNLRGDLYLAAIHSQQNPVPHIALDRANPGHNSYLPTFNPKVEGGYMWVAFYSRRDYGHVLSGQERPQVWLAAIDADADPATALTDPSHPAFWLPGQRTDTDNLSSFFAPRPCQDETESCVDDASCCGDNLCRPKSGNYQCVPADAACGLVADTCTGDASCCDGLLCAPNTETGSLTCQNPGETCSQTDQVCELDGDCCQDAGLCVDDGAGTSRCLLCAAMGESCSVDGDCCAGAGRCIGESCFSIQG